MNSLTLRTSASQTHPDLGLNCDACGHPFRNGDQITMFAGGMYCEDTRCVPAVFRRLHNALEDIDNRARAAGAV